MDPATDQPEMTYDDQIEAFAGELHDLCVKYAPELVATDLSGILIIQSTFITLGEVSP
jgi:hypothetical protein